MNETEKRIVRTGKEMKAGEFDEFMLKTKVESFLASSQRHRSSFHLFIFEGAFIQLQVNSEIYIFLIEVMLELLLAALVP